MANDAPVAIASREKRVAVLVTHGVGDAEPGEVVRLVTECVGQRPDVEMDRHVEVRLLDDADPLDHSQGQPESLSLPKAATRARAKKFPVTVRCATLDDGRRLTFAELYWADLTRVGTGRTGAMLSLFRVIFEAHYIIDAILDEKRNFLTRALRYLLISLSNLLRGPLAGMTAATASVCAVMLFWPTTYERSDHAAVPALTILVLLFLVSYGVLVWTHGRGRTGLQRMLDTFASLFVWTRRRDETAWYTTLVWTALVSGLAAIALAASFALHGFDVIELPKERAPYFDRPYNILILGWIGWSILYLLALVVAIILRFTNRTALVATGILALQFLLWTAVIGTAVSPILNRAEQVKSLQPVEDGIRAEIKRLAVEIQGLSGTAQSTRKSSYGPISIAGSGFWKSYWPLPAWRPTGSTASASPTARTEPFSSL
jgi:hypothetical protein